MKGVWGEEGRKEEGDGWGTSFEELRKINEIWVAFPNGLWENNPIALFNATHNHKAKEGLVYVTPNFRTKKEFRLAVATQKCVDYFQPAGIGLVPRDGTITVEGPHYPEPHRWYATCVVRDGKIISVK